MGQIGTTRDINSIHTLASKGMSVSFESIGKMLTEATHAGRGDEAQECIEASTITDRGRTGQGIVNLCNVLREVRGWPRADSAPGHDWTPGTEPKGHDLTTGRLEKNIGR